MPTQKRLRELAVQGAFHQRSGVLNAISFLGGIYGGMNAVRVLKPLLVPYVPKTALHMTMNNKSGIGPSLLNLSDMLIIVIGFAAAYALTMLVLVLVLNAYFAMRGAMVKEEQEKP